MSTATRPNPRDRFHGFETIAVPVIVRVGSLRITLGSLSELAPGQVLTLETCVGSPFHLLARGVLLAHVEPVATDAGIALKLVEHNQEESEDDSTI